MIGCCLVATYVVGAMAAAPTFPQGRAASGGYPLTIRDDAGYEITVPHRPERVVSVVPSVTEIVCAVGACGALVGVDDYSNHPQEVRALPRVGNLYAPGLEAVIALEPDLVLASRYGHLAETLRRAGLRVFVLQSETLDDLFRNVEAVGRLMGREREAAELDAGIRAEFAWAERVLAESSAPRPTVYYEIDETPYAAGPGSFIGELIERAGGRNVLPASAGPFPKVSPEAIVLADPGFILLGDAPYGVDARRIATRPGWGRLSAVREGRVVALSSEQVDWLSRPGPRIVDGLRLLFAILHPDLAARSGPVAP